MSDSIWTTTLEEFRQRLASREPAPAGVTASCVSAVSGLALLSKVLDITLHRKSFAGDSSTFADLLDKAAIFSNQIARCADADIAAFREYLTEHSPASLRQAIEVPLHAGESAVAALHLCDQAAGLIPASLKPDLDAARALLSGAIRAMLFSIHSNLAQEIDPQFRDNAQARAQQLEKAIHSPGRFGGQ